MNSIFKKNNNFAFRLINLLIIIIALFYYNQLLSMQKELSKANAIIEKVEEMQTQEQVEVTDTDIHEETSQNEKYIDGLYQGEGEGFGGIISLTVMIENGVMTEINIISAEKEDGAYFDMATKLFDTIIATKNTNVDAISGATFSSNGILTAVEQALEKAVDK